MLKTALWGRGDTQKTHRKFTPTLELTNNNYSTNTTEINNTTKVTQILFRKPRASPWKKCKREKHPSARVGTLNTIATNALLKTQISVNVAIATY